MFMLLQNYNNNNENFIRMAHFMQSRSPKVFADNMKRKRTKNQVTEKLKFIFKNTKGVCCLKIQREGVPQLRAIKRTQSSLTRLLAGHFRNL